MVYSMSMTNAGKLLEHAEKFFIWSSYERKH